MKDRTLIHDRRAVTPAVTHTLTIAFTSILVIALLIGAGGFLEAEERDSTRQELTSIGNRLADEIDRVDSLAMSGSSVDITTRHPAEITGGTYTVSFVGPDVYPDHGNGTLVLESSDPQVTVRVPVTNATDVTLDRASGRTFELIAADPGASVTAGESTDPGGLTLRVGVGENIRKNPLGSRLISSNVLPIPAFDVEPTPIVTGQTHFFNGTGSFDPDGNVSEHKWDLRDNGLFTKVGERPPHRFAAPGKYNLTLRVTDDAQSAGSRTLTRNVTVSGLEYNRNLSSPSHGTLTFSFHNNWSEPIRLDALYVDDLGDNGYHLDDGNNDTSVSEVEVDTDSDGDRDTYVEYGAHWDPDDCGPWRFRPDCPDPPIGPVINDSGITIDLDQPVDFSETPSLDEANESAPDDVPTVQSGDNVTITLRGIDEDLGDTAWGLGLRYLRNGTPYETTATDNAGGTWIRNYSVSAVGDEVRVRFEAGEPLDSLDVQFGGSGTSTNSRDLSDFSQSGTTPDGAYVYEYTTAPLDSGRYWAEIDGATADSDGQQVYHLPDRDDAVAIDGVKAASWNSITNWDDVTAERGVVHEGFSDHAADEISLGYPSNDTGGSNLTAYWPMDGTGGATMEDVAGSSDDGDTTDIYDETVGLFGSTSYAFNASSSLVDGIASTNALSGGDNATITVSTWIHPRQAITRSDGAAVIGKLNDSNSGGDWGLVVDTSCPPYANGGCDATPVIGYYGGNTTDEYALMHGPVTQADAWHHVAFVMDGEAGRLDLYYDGRLVESDNSFPAFASANTSRPVEIGEHPRTDEPYDGYVDETRVYNRSLTGAQIERLVEAPRHGSFTTDWQNTSSAVDSSAVNLTAALDRNGGNVTVRVETNASEMSDPITLDRDHGSYDVRGLSTRADGFRLHVTVRSSSRNRSPVIDSLVVNPEP